MPGALESSATASPRGERLERIAFVGTVLAAGGLFWVAPRPPMGDLPQHAGQIALLRDLLTGTSPWGDLVRINAFTPYLLGYGLATLLALVMPVLTALKLVLTLAFYGFVAAGVRLRRELGSDPRLDWLLVPGFFGFSFQYGFYTFLVAAPIGLLFVLFAKRFAEAPTRRAGARLVVAGTLLFFSHGLVFLFAIAIGAGFVLALPRSRRTLSALAPYAVLGALAVAYFVTARMRDPMLAAPDPQAPFEWRHAWDWHRLFAFPIYVMASSLKDRVFFPALLFMVAAPWLLRARLRTRERIALVPIAAIVAIWLLVPAEALKTAYLYHRFALFFLPAYALAFRRAEPADLAAPRAVAVQIGLALACWFFLGTVALRERRFAAESASFEELLASAEPGQRALSLVYAPSSDTIRHAWTYHTYPLWYQAERQGFVDFNFAHFLPQIVRFRPERAPPMRENVTTLEWHAIDAKIYRYFFVRHTTPLAAGLFDNDECRVALVKESGAWSLYERRECASR